MDRYCPECNSTMTPSLVGYLCSNCGQTQRFYSAQESSMAIPAAPKSVASATNTDPKPHLHTTKHPNKPKNKVKSTLKRLMVPELAPPHPHLIGDGDDNIKPVLADKIEDELATPALIAELPKTKSDGIANQELDTRQPEQSTLNNNMSATKAVPNQSGSLTELESALHPQKNTSVWVMLALALLMLIVAASVLFLIILS